MTENGIIQIVTLILSLLGPVLTLWVKAKLADVHHELNSRLDQYKQDLAKKADAAEVAALARGITEGIKLERKRTEEITQRTAEEVFNTAHQVAKAVITAAKEDKEK
ncbi:MAG: hypothetical protein V4563_13005 [Pseudomonadota bacterium]